MGEERTYLCIDLKSFYASVECVERGLDPLTTRLVVADPTRTDKTICLAVTPAMKKLGVGARCRVFEIPTGIKYTMAPPRMALYIDYATRIYEIYLRFVAAEDIHVYSIDEVFMDITRYYRLRAGSPKAFAMEILHEIHAVTGLTATCGIGSNLYLAKIALDISSKHNPSHIAILTEESYRRELWRHRPITDFWRVGRGTAQRLQRLGIDTMEGVAKADEEILYKAFGVDAELLIDHAWGRESTTMADIKAYRPSGKSLNRGQVLTRDYSFEEGRIIVREMAESLALELCEQGLSASSVDLMLGYSYRSGRVPVHGSSALDLPTASIRTLSDSAVALYERIMDREDHIRRLFLTYGRLEERPEEQLDLFADRRGEERERRLTRAMLHIRKKYGGNGIVKCMDLQEAATAIERNRQIGGHRA